MKIFAQLDSNNKIINTVMVSDTDAPTEEAGKQFLAKTLKHKASQFVQGDDTDLKKTPHMGNTWYPDEGYFKGDPAYPSFIWSEEDWLWRAPVEYPEGAGAGEYKWDENSGSWIIDPDYAG